MSLPYIGSGPYCYSNSVAMMLGAAAPSPAEIEVIGGGPFGMMLLGGDLPFFSPYAWEPDCGIDLALGFLGWECRRVAGEDAATARVLLREAVAEGPVLVGPVEMGLLRHQPEMRGAMGADHWVVVIAIEEDMVVMHDPHGFPYATLPLDEFTEAWRAELVDWADPPFVMRSHFVQVRDVSVDDAVRESLPNAVRLLRNEFDTPTPPGTVGTATGMERLAQMVEQGLPPNVHGHLVHFAVRSGARRLNDAAVLLARLGEGRASKIATGQARDLGSLQFALVAGERGNAAATLRRMAPSYEELAATLALSLDRV
jgi:hypothetical protein